MKTYNVTAEVTISVHTTVTANSKDEAADVAAQRPLISLCHQCGGGQPYEEWCTSGELDGDPDKFKVEVDE